MKKIVAIIPARYESTRFPGKPLANICGKPMIQWVYEQVKKTRGIYDVYVATDDIIICENVKKFGGHSIMTSKCSCGTERTFQACKDIDCEIVLNIQGDEPLIKPQMIQDLIKAFETPDVLMATLKKCITDRKEIDNPNVVKVITDTLGYAIYFSRFPIPFVREANKEILYYKHIGIYGYRKQFLEKFVSLPNGLLEKAENLEQLRAIENGYKILVNQTEYQSIGVDVPSDIQKVEEEMKKEGIG